MTRIRVGLPGIPDRSDPDQAIEHHLPYGEGTLRADPLRDALGQFDRPATVISESPDLASSEAIRADLTG